jgi:hypothetical protein
MSSDNYLWVRKWRGKYVIEQRFASSEYDERQKPFAVYGEFGTAQEAVLDAMRQDHHSYFEYGVSVSSAVQDDWEAAALANTAHNEVLGKVTPAKMRKLRKIVAAGTRGVTLQVVPAMRPPSILIMGLADYKHAVAVAKHIQAFDSPGVTALLDEVERLG